MIINAVSLQKYSSPNLTINSKQNLNFTGILQMGKDARRCCGYYDDDTYATFSNEWTKKLPSDTSITIYQKNSNGYFENYIVKSFIWDKNNLVCKKCLEEEIPMYVDGIFEDGHVCRDEDVETVKRNRDKLLKSFENHLKSIKTKLSNNR